MREIDDGSTNACWDDEAVIPKAPVRRASLAVAAILPFLNSLTARTKWAARDEVLGPPYKTTRESGREIHRHGSESPTNAA